MSEVKVPRSKFIEVWEKSASAKEVAQELQLKVTSVQARASKYRADGIPLKNMSPGGRAGRLSLDDAHAELAAIRGVSVEVIKAEVEKRKADKEARKAEKAQAPAGDAEQASA